jgi:hypothetical protein
VTRPGPALSPRLAALWPRLLALWLASACWTGAPPPPAAPPTASGADPTDPCPARLVAVVHDAATAAPLAGATVVVETARGSVATLLTDEHGRIDTAAVRPPARLRIYYGEAAVEHALARCQPPLRIGVRLAPP